MDEEDKDKINKEDDVKVDENQPVDENKPIETENNESSVTMTRRTNNIDLCNEDVLLVHPNDAKKRELNTGDIGRLYSGRGEVALKVEITNKVKEGIVFTTFHFPEHMVNMVSSGDLTGIGDILQIKDSGKFE